MEQSILSMRRLLSRLERDLELSLAVAMPPRRKAKRHRSMGHVGQEVVDALRSNGIEAGRVDIQSLTPTSPSDPGQVAGPHARPGWNREAGEQPTDLGNRSLK
jgi:hypothetical protein